KDDLSIHEAALKLCEWFNIAFDTVAGNDGDEETPNASKSKPKPSPSPSDSPPKPAAADENAGPNPPLKFRLEKLDRSHPYFAERGLSQETIIDFGLGFF